MARTSEIDEFLKWFAKAYEQNPNVPITSDSIYSALTKYGFSEEEIENRNAQDVIDKLEKYYENSTRLHVYVDSRQPGFLQFTSYSEVFSNEADSVKLYVSVPKENYEESIKLIFDYIEKNNIKSVSKVSKVVRADSIVLRLPNADEARKVIDFINNNKMITSVSKKTNPFLYREGVVGIGFDRWLSYNSVVSEIVQKYFQNLKDNNKLNTASYEDFAKFTRQMHRDYFNNCDQIRQVDTFQSLNSRHKCFDSKGGGINNLENVIRLIANSVEDNVNLDAYFRYYDSVTNKLNIDSFSSYYDEMYKKKQYVDSGSYLPKERRNDAIMLNRPYVNTNQPVNNVVIDSSNLNPLPKDRRNDAVMISDLVNGQKVMSDDGKEVNIRKLLDDYVDYALEKYGTVDLVTAYLGTYVGGNEAGITRDKNFRADFIKFIPPVLVAQLTNNDLNGYIRERYQLKNDNQKNSTEVNPYLVFYNASVDTVRKYGPNQLIAAIARASGGSYSCFTNGNNNNREKLYKYVDPSLVGAYCKYYLNSVGVNEISN